MSDTDNIKTVFETTITTDGEGRTYRISRINVDEPIYDGTEGYTVFKIRDVSSSLPVPQEILTVMVKGQFRLIAVDLNDLCLYALRLQQVGAGMRITNVCILSPDSSSMMDLLPKGANIKAQFAALSPDGRYCLLFGEYSTVVDLSSGVHGSLIMNEKFPQDATNPVKPWDAGCDLSGRYVTCEWDSDRMGRILLKNQEGETYSELFFKVPDLCERLRNIEVPPTWKTIALERVPLIHFSLPPEAVLDKDTWVPPHGGKHWIIGNYTVTVQYGFWELLGASAEPEWVDSCILEVNSRYSKSLNYNKDKLSTIWVWIVNERVIDDGEFVSEPLSAVVTANSMSGSLPEEALAILASVREAGDSK